MMERENRTRNQFALLACAWAVIFSIPSFVWAAGGIWGLETIAEDIEEALGAAAESWVIALTGVFKLALGAFAMSFAFRDLGNVPRQPRIVAGYVAAILIGGYGLAGFADRILMLTGVRSTPEALGDYAARWHAFFWDPIWMLGGVLFWAATRRFARLSSMTTVSPG